MRDATGLLTHWLRPEPLPKGYHVPNLSPKSWQSLVRLANHHLLAPALFAALRRSRLLNAIPTEPRQYLAHLYDLNRLRNILIRRQTIELVGALNAGSVAPLLLKGALVLMIDPPAYRAGRMMADIDFAVPKEQTDAVLEVLARLGYEVLDHYPEGHHAYGEFARAGSPAALDLHFELIDQKYLLPAAEVWSRSHHVIRNGITFRVPDVSDRVFHNLLHAQIHHVGNYYRGGMDLRQLLEFATLTAANGDRIDWQRLQDRMASHGLTDALDSYLTSAHRLFGTAWPFERRPSPFSRFHNRLCLVQIRHPILLRLTSPAGNLCAAFSQHRMQQLYVHLGGGPILWRWRHLRQFLSRHGARFAIARLFRS